MDFNLKQWRFQQRDDQSPNPAKLQKLFFEPHINTKQEVVVEKKEHEQKTQCSSASPQLHLFVPTDGKNEQNHISTSLQSSTTLPKNEMGNGGSYFSYGQWQELELQALIYRHMLAGAVIPPQLLQMVHRSLFNISAPHPANSLSSPYSVHPLQHYSHYHPALMQSGYWGRGAMDPEPGRCKRTDGKKWRCARDIVAGQKYCERHVHRGRSRSRKPVELPAATLGSGKTGNVSSTQGTLESRANFDVSRPSTSIDNFHPQRPSGSQAEDKFTTEMDNKVNRNSKSGGQALRHFFDDWSNRSSDSSASSSSLSISTFGNVASDFSLKLATGNRNDSGVRENTQPGWASTNQVAPMGGPLAEALRSSGGSNVSPTSVLNLVK